MIYSLRWRWYRFRWQCRLARFWACSWTARAVLRIDLRRLRGRPRLGDAALRRLMLITMFSEPTRMR
jgi:hypothetical protein